MYKLKVLIITSLTLLCTQARAQWDYTIRPPRPISRTDTVTMSFIGDVMMHARQMEYDFTQFLAPLERITRDADVSVANMEFTLAGPPYSGYPSFSAPDGYAEDAARKGVDIFLLANNHILDKGPSGLKRTLHRYGLYRDSLRTQYTGAGADTGSFKSMNPLVIACKDLRFALVNFTYGTNYPEREGYPRVSRMKREEVADMIQRAKDRNVDYIIALPHWGTEYRLKHSAEQEEWARWLVEQGVDLIIGTHPHVVQDSTHISGVPVIYSLGNAVSNMSVQNTRLGLAVTARFVRERDGRSYMLEPLLDFTWCTLPGTLTEGYAAIMVEDYKDRRDAWKSPSDHDEMTATLRRVKQETGLTVREIQITEE